MQSLQTNDYDLKNEGLAWFDIQSTYKVRTRESVASPGKLVPDYSAIQTSLKQIPGALRINWYFDIWVTGASFDD